MVNKLILTRANPIADVVYGIDNTLIGKAEAAGVLLPMSDKGGVVSLPGAVSIDYGYVTLNYDKAWFAKKQLPLPKTLDDLTRPAYKDLLVVENPPPQPAWHFCCPPFPPWAKPRPWPSGASCVITA
jgi:thiamine transport system substrate-binding protein